MRKLLVIFVISMLMPFKAYSDATLPPPVTESTYIESTYIHQFPAKDLIKDFEIESKNRKGDDQFFYLYGLLYWTAAFDKNFSVVKTGDKFVFDLFKKERSKTWNAIKNKLEYEPSAFYINPSDKKSQRYEEYIDLALSNFLIALNLNPKHLLAKVATGIVYEEKGLIDKAIAEYRIALNEAWEQEKNKKWCPVNYLSYPPILLEVGSHLINILDPKSDAAEIRDIEDKIKKIKNMIDQNCFSDYHCLG